MVSDLRRLSDVVGLNSERESLVVLRNRLAYEIDELGSETGGSLALLPALSKRFEDVLNRLDVLGVEQKPEGSSPMDELFKRRKAKGLA